MQIGLYVIYDVKAQAILGNMIHLHKHEATACRLFADVATLPDSMVLKHPDDFNLVRIAFIDDESLQIQPQHAITLRGTDLVAALTENKNDAS